MSRLDVFIDRMVSQRACLDFAIAETAAMPGPVFELGLGNGRTYHHMRERIAGREIYVFERAIASHPESTPPEDRTLLGDVSETLPAALDRFAAALEAGLAQGSDARERARAIGDAYVRFATEHPAAYQLMSEISQVDESRYPELVRASRRARETMVGYVRDMIREGMMDGDADLIGYMFWSTLHGIVVLDMAGRLGGEIDADTLRKKTMRTLLAGMAVSPPRRDDES